MISRIILIVLLTLLWGLLFAERPAQHDANGNRLTEAKHVAP